MKDWVLIGGICTYSAMPAQLNYYPVKYEAHFTGTRYPGLTGGELQPGS